MEQDQSVNQEPQIQPAPFQSQESSNNVSFPTVGGEKKSGGAKTLLIIGILILVAILGFVIYKSASKKSVDVSATPAPADDVTTPSDQVVATIAPAVSASPATTINKAKIQIQVQNGTGISGEAAYLQSQLSKLGYSNVKVGNSSSSTATTTTVTFSSTLDSGVVAEITQELNSIYQTVATNNSTTATFDAVIVTGLRKGATPKPVSSPSASPSASPST